MTTTHAKLSPSKAHRYLACPGSVVLEAKYPDESGDAAVDGTHSHSLLQHCIDNRIVDAARLIDTKLTDHEGDFVVDSARATRVNVALAYIIAQVAKFPNGVIVQSESQSDPAKWVGRDDMGGTVDVTIVAPGYLEIIDYKDGMGAVSPDTPQLELYGLGKMNQHEHVTLTIIQPKLATKGMPPISSVTVSFDYLMQRAKFFKERVALTDLPDAPLVPGEDQCRFCKAKGSCPALNAKATELFKPVALASLTDSAVAKNPTEMTGDQIAEFLEAAPLIRQTIAGVEAEAERRLKAGEKVRGFKLVNGRGSRKWSLPEDQMAEKLVKLGIPKGEVYEQTLLSPAKAEKLRWKNRAGEVVSLTERKLKTMQSEYVTTLAGGPTVAPESDSRPAIITDASNLFSSVAPPSVPDVLPSWLV